MTIACSSDALKSAAEFVERAAEKLRVAGAEQLPVSEAARQSALAEISRIRLTLSMMRRDLAAVAAAANRRAERRNRSQKAK